jgi:ubiquinone/menaquinone biosynthesis C-methylase UbiE
MRQFLRGNYKCNIEARFSSNMALTRILEPEVMSGADEAAEYDDMDFSSTDALFAGRAAALARPGTWIVDLGCGNAKIPLAIAARVANRICAVEMSWEMLAVGARNRGRAGVDPRRFAFVSGDVKRLPLADASAGLVVSNSLMHHIADPRDAFREAARLAGPSGAILIRDLVRPDDEATLERLVATYAGESSPLQRKLFADSLRAALSLDEVRVCLADCGMSGVEVTQITDRHWSAERA